MLERTMESLAWTIERVPARWKQRLQEKKRCLFQIQGRVIGIEEWDPTEVEQFLVARFFET